SSGRSTIGSYKRNPRGARPAQEKVSMGFFSRLFGRRSEEPGELPDISSAGHGGATHLGFRLTEASTNVDRSFPVVLRATYRGEVIGFALELGPSWSGDFGKEIGKALGGILGGQLGGMFAGAMGELSLNQGTILFRSIGSESDRFVIALAQVYEVELAAATM